MEAVIAPEEKRITLDAEKRGVQGIAMYLTEKQVSHSSYFIHVSCFVGSVFCQILSVTYLVPISINRED